MFFTGKNFLVTGAGRGIGRALAKEIAKAGGVVYALSRTKETLDSLAQESDRIHPILADVSDWDRTREIMGALDVFDGVVNNSSDKTRGVITQLLILRMELLPLPIVRGRCTKLRSTPTPWQQLISFKRRDRK